MELIRIHPSDNVAVALSPLSKGGSYSFEAGNEKAIITALEDIERGHKIALCDINKGEEIIKYGNTIAIAKKAIRKGEWIHTHNAGTGLSEDDSFVYDHHEYILPISNKPKFFNGFRRTDGSVGIRNEIWIIPTVGCVNCIAEQLVSMNTDLIKGSIDGLYAYTHPFGCSQLGDDHANTRKILADLVHHPNAGGVLVLGLGCENLTMDQFKKELGNIDTDRVKFMICQNEEDELETGSKLLLELAENAAKSVREAVPARELVIGMKCGGSDGLSGITANPTVGSFSDKLISMGGTTILTEVPEMFGAEQILFNRCKDKETFDRAAKMVDDFKEYFTSHGQVVYENPSPGNKAGGITTLEDKSCGCVQKGGSAQITDVLAYGERVHSNGLNLLSGPGNDLVSTTALTAAGAHLILFTTGRGTPFGAPAPTVKISTNSALFTKKHEWIDFNAGTVAEGESLDSASERLLDYVLDVASGKQTQAEKHGCREISIFKDGVVL